MTIFFIIALLVLASCNPSNLSEWRVEGVSIVRNLVEELELIETIADLEERKSSIKKKYAKLIQIMIEGDRYEDIDALKPESFFSNALRDQYIRIYQIEGGKELLFEIQKESLHKLDQYLKKNV